jgi:hypothetical protein
MKIRSFTELRRVDETAARFTSTGFSTGRMLTPASAARTHQASIADTDLVDVVPQDVRRNFDRLRDLHTYGVLHYDLYTLVHQTRPFVFEHALRERFITRYEGAVPLADEAGEVKVLETSSFQDVYLALRRGGYKKAVECDGRNVRFDASLRSLVSWARAMKYLRGQQNRFRDDALIVLRNHFAHPEGFSITSPIESARSIAALAETINHMWGQTTPGGRRYPGPIPRHVYVVAVSPDGESKEILRAEQLDAAEADPGWRYEIFRAAGGLGDVVIDYREGHEVAPYPVDRLWGPGSARDAAAWLAEERSLPDAIDHLDRRFAIRVDGGRTHLPRLPEAASGLPPDARDGEWHLVESDYPSDALAHVQALLVKDTKCSARRPCPACPATTVAVGAWDEIFATPLHLNTPPGKNPPTG